MIVISLFRLCDPCGSTAGRYCWMGSAEQEKWDFRSGARGVLRCVPSCLCLLHQMFHFSFHETFEYHRARVYEQVNLFISVPTSVWIWSKVVHIVIFSPSLRHDGPLHLAIVVSMMKSSNCFFFNFRLFLFFRQVLMCSGIPSTIALCPARSGLCYQKQTISHEADHRWSRDFKNTDEACASAFETTRVSNNRRFSGGFFKDFPFGIPTYAPL